MDAEKKTARDPEQIAKEIDAIEAKKRKLNEQREALVEEYEIATQDRIPKVF